MSWINGNRDIFDVIQVILIALVPFLIYKISTKALKRKEAELKAIEKKISLLEQQKSRTFDFVILDQKLQYLLKKNQTYKQEINKTIQENNILWEKISNGEINYDDIRNFINKCYS